jgi:hypothetical protein
VTLLPAPWEYFGVVVRCPPDELPHPPVGFECELAVPKRRRHLPGSPTDEFRIGIHVGIDDELVPEALRLLEWLAANGLDGEGRVLDVLIFGCVTRAEPGFLCSFSPDLMRRLGGLAAPLDISVYTWPEP